MSATQFPERSRLQSLVIWIFAVIKKSKHQIWDTNALQICYRKSRERVYANVYNEGKSSEIEAAILLPFVNRGKYENDLISAGSAQYEELKIKFKGFKGGAYSWKT